MRVEGIMAMVETLQDNYGDKTTIKNAVVKHSTQIQLRVPSMTVINIMMSLATLDIPTTTYGDFVPVMLEKLPEKLLNNVLKEHPCANPAINRLIQMIHNEVKRLEQVAYISHNNQPCKPKPPPPP